MGLTVWMEAGSCWLRWADWTNTGGRPGTAL